MSVFYPWVRKIPMEKGMATHSSILGWRISWTEEPGGLQSVGHKESDTTERLTHTHTHTHTHGFIISEQFFSIISRNCCDIYYKSYLKKCLYPPAAN